MILIGVVIVLIVGVAVKFGAAALNGNAGRHLGRVREVPSISWVELAIGSVVCVVVVVPLTVWAGNKVAVSSQTKFYENWGGWETSADVRTTYCERDGSCRHMYQCDPYLVTRTRSVTDSKGASRTETYTETAYHRCPYVDRELTYTVDTTVGSVMIADHIFPENAERNRWRQGGLLGQGGGGLLGLGEVGLPPVAQGEPLAWRQARDRLRAGDPGPVIKRASYENFILASQTTILKRFSGSIDRYRGAGLLPTLTSQVDFPYHQQKVYPVGVSLPGDDQAWQEAAMRLDAALGSDLQGDLHVVVVDAGKAGDPDEYAGALTAYWQGPALGKNALSKNGIVLVLGTGDGKTVTWARAMTGMPVGNDELLVDLQRRLAGQPLDAAVLLGRASASTSTDGKTISDPGDGLVAAAVWGEHRYQRVCMTCSGSEDEGVGFSYLKSQIEPTGGQRALILLGTALASCLIWGLCLALPDTLVPTRRRTY